MEIKSKLIEGFPSLKTTETVQWGLETCLNKSYERIFIVGIDNTYLGSISQEQLLDFENEEIIANIDFEQIEPLFENDSVLDLFKIPIHIDYVAVVNQERKYIGAINKNKAIFEFLNKTTIAQAGTVLYLEMPVIDFSMANIARLIEENNVKILASFTETFATEDIEYIRLILKLGQGNTNAVVQTLERFNFQIIGIYGYQKNSYENNTNYNYMMKYLEM